jgi:Zn-dependent alcohol dehydrogenase
VDSKLQLAKELGATILINSSDRNLELADEVKRLTGGVGPSVTIDATGLASIAEKAFDLTAKLGRLVVVGVSSRTAELNLNLSQLMSVGVL